MQTSSLRLLGRKVLVTGSSKGIGRGIAVRMAQEGADVVVNYNTDPKGAEEALTEVLATGRQGVAIQGDTSSVDGVGALVAASARALGGLDVLVIALGECISIGQVGSRARPRDAVSHRVPN